MNIQLIVDGQTLLEKEIDETTMTASGVWSAIASEVAAGILVKALSVFAGEKEGGSK